MRTEPTRHRRCTMAALAAAVCASTAVAVPAANAGSAGARPAQTGGSHASRVTAHPANVAPAGHGRSYSWSPRPTGVDEQFRGLAAVNRRVAWVSGEKGSVLRTNDGGRTWSDVSPAAAKTDGLALRDIEARDGRRAEALSIGEGGDSRIFRTDDGGRTWRQALTNADPKAFYDCMAFDRRGVGLAMSDPVDGHFRMARTTDGGRSWKVLPTTGMPAALDGEFGFAASGTCLVSAQGPFARPGEFWFATGGQQPRVFHTLDAGRSWTVTNALVRGGDAAGIYSIAFRNSWMGVAVGGDYTAPNDGSDAAATKFGPFPWKPSRNSLGGYRSGVAYLPGWGAGVVAVGPTGSDVSADGGRTWRTFDTTAYDGIHCAKDGSCWASGPHGAVAQLQLGKWHRSRHGG